MLYVFIIFAVIGGALANCKNRNAILWAIVCGLIPIMVVWVLALNKVEDSPEEKAFKILQKEHEKKEVQKKLDELKGLNLND